VELIHDQNKKTSHGEEKIEDEAGTGTSVAQWESNIDSG